MRLVTALKAFLHALKNPPSEEVDNAHLKLLSLLQKQGRLIDFLQEDISGYSDEQVGMAVRDIHAGCRKELNDLLALRPVMTTPEGGKVTIPASYNAEEIKLVGNVRGKPPYEGILVHKGWRATKALPKSLAGPKADVIVPAEVEVR